MSLKKMRQIKNVFRSGAGSINLGGVEFKIEDEVKWCDLMELLEILYRNHGGCVGAFLRAWAEAFGSEADDTDLWEMANAKFYPAVTLEEVREELDEDAKLGLSCPSWDEARNWMRESRWGVISLGRN